MRRSLWIALGLLAIATSAILVSCGSKSSTNPAPPGGGTPVTFNFTFPATGVSHEFFFPTTAASYAYHCTPHQGSGMTGTITVAASATLDSQVVQVGPGGTLTFSPASVSIKPGGKIRWVNASAMTNHTVTR